MARRDILILPDPVLRKVATPIAAIDDRIRALAADMLETMYAAPGIGLAGPQVGVLERLFVCDIADDEDKPRPLVVINPTIVARSDEVAPFREGCLSIPDITEDVERPVSITLDFIDEHGNPRRQDMEGLLARCVQHELDHLNGVLFIDHLSRLKRDRITKKFQKQARLGSDRPGRVATPA